MSHKSSKQKDKKKSLPKEKIKLLTLEPCPKCGGKAKVDQQVARADKQHMTRKSDKMWCFCLACGHKSKEIPLTKGEDRRATKNRAITIWNEETKKTNRLNPPAPRS